MILVCDKHEMTCVPFELTIFHALISYHGFQNKYLDQG